MACECISTMCDKFVASTAVAFTGGNLVVTIPAGDYKNGCKYCIWIAQAIPTTTTINAPVVIQIGAGTVQYPLTNRCCVQLTACDINTNTRYSTRVVTNTTSGTFRLLCNQYCSRNNRLASINGTAPVAAAEGGA